MLQVFDCNWSVNEVSAMDKKSRKRFCRHYRPLSVKTRSILCKAKTKKEVMNALLSHLSENEVSAMDRKGIKDDPMGTTDHFQPKRGQYIMQSTEQRALEHMNGTFYRECGHLKAYKVQKRVLMHIKGRSNREHIQVNA